MRPVDGHINNGKTRTAFSCLRLRHLKTSTDTEKVFSFFLADARFGFDKPVLAIANLPHLHLPSADANTLAKAKELNCHRTQIGVLRTLSGHLAPLSQKPKPQAYGIFSF